MTIIHTHSHTRMHGQAHARTRARAHTLTRCCRSQVKVDPTVAVDLLSLANMYQVARLKQKCVGIIEKNVDNDTIRYACRGKH